MDASNFTPVRGIAIIIALASSFSLYKDCHGLDAHDNPYKIIQVPSRFPRRLRRAADSDENLRVPRGC